MDWLNYTKNALLDDLRKLELFDAGAWLGKTNDFPLMRKGDPLLLEEIQNRFRIKGMLISDWDAEQSGRLPVAAANRKNWFAAASINPGEEIPDDAGVKAVRMFPASRGFSLAAPETDQTASALAERKMPLFVFHTETTFDDVRALAERHPKLIIVLESQTRKVIYHHPAILTLAEACPNLRLEISNFCGQGMLDYTVQKLGPSRLIFGSFAPASDPLVPIGMLLQSEMPWEHKKLIAGDNIRGIIAEVE